MTGYTFSGGGVVSETDPIAVHPYTTQAKTASFTAAPGFVYLIDSTSGAVTVTLPSANSAGQTFAVKWVSGSNAVTLQRAGSDTIGPSATSATMGLTNEVWEFLSSGSGQWNLLGGNKPLSSLDARYALLSGATFTGEVVTTDLKVTGTTGAANAGRFVGVTTTNAPASGTYVVGDFILTQNGQMFVCVTAGTPGVWVTPVDIRDRLASGEETMDRTLVSNSTAATLSSQAMRLAYFTSRKSGTSTQVRVFSGATAAAATPTLCRIGLYTIASNGAGTLVASTANDTALFASVNTTYTKSWSSSYAMVAGQQYALAWLVVTGTTAPQIPGATLPGPMSAEIAISPRLGGSLGGQTDLPASFADASLVNVGFRLYGAVLP